MLENDKQETENTANAPATSELSEDDTFGKELEKSVSNMIELGYITAEEGDKIRSGGQTALMEKMLTLSEDQLYILLGKALNDMQGQGTIF